MHTCRGATGISSPWFSGLETRQPLDLISHSTKPVIACDDVSVIGAPFYVMEMVDGRVLTREKPDEVRDPEVARAISTDIVRTLADASGFKVIEAVRS